MALNEYDDALEQVGTAPAVKPAAVVNPYDDVIKAQDAGSQQQLRTSLSQATDQSPDAAAEATKIAASTNLPLEVVQRNLPAMKKRALIADTPFRAMLQDTPALADWAKEPANAAVSHDDMEQLGALEWLTSMPSRAISQSLNEQAYGELRTKSIFQPLTQEEQDRLASYKLHATMGGELGAGNSWFRGALTKTMKLLATLTGPEAIPTAAGAAGGAVIGIPGGVPGIIAGAKLGAEAGYTYGLASSAFKTAAGSSYDEYLEATDAVGRKLDPEVAKALAVTNGAINAGLMTFGGRVIGAGIEAAGAKVSAALTKNAIKAAIRQPSVVGAIAEMMKGYGTTLTEGTALMVAMKTGDILTHALASSSGERQPIAGQVEPGNVDLFKQPAVRNPDGSVSTVDSFSVNEDGQEVLLPTVTPDGRHLSQDAALEEYRKTGRHLGKFDSVQAANAFAEQLHQDYAAGKYVQPTIGQQLLNAAKEGVQSFAIIGATGPALGLVHEFKAAKRAEQGVAFFQALGEGIEQSKTAKRLPEAAQQFLEKATKDGPIPTLYTSVSDWTKYWQDKGVDPSEMATELTGSADAYEHALKTGEDLAIPTARYATRLAATEHNAHFADELRLGPEEMNGRESKALLEEMATAPDTGTPAEAGSPIYQAALEQLTKGGGLSEDTASQYATLVDSAFGSMAERAGVDPVELYRQYGLTVDRPDLPDEGQKAAPAGQAASPEQQGLPVDERGAVDAHGVPVDSQASQVEAAAAGLRPSSPNAPIPVMADVIGAAAAMRAENPQLDRQAQAARDKALKFGRIPEPKGRGGVVDKNADAAENPESYLNAARPTADPRADATAEEGRGPADAQGQQPGADVVGRGEGRGNGDRAEPRGTPAGIPEVDEVFTEQPKAETTARLTPQVERELRRILDELQRDSYEGASWDWLEEGPKTGNAAGGAANKRGGHGGSAVYYDVLSHSPMNLVTSGRTKGQPARRAHGDRGKVEAAVKDLLESGHATTNLMEGALRVAENRDAGIWRDLSRPSLPPSWGEPVTREFTDALSAAIDEAQQPTNMLEEAGFENDAVDTAGEDADTSFDFKEFNQSLFDDLEPPDPKVDTLADTGEQQPRLPGDVGDVREQDVKTPEFEAPFSLTSEIAKPRGKQTTLFQGEKPAELTRENVAAWAQEVKDRAGSDLVDFSVQLTSRGDLQLDTISVARGAMRAGLGSKVMLELTRFADLNGRRIILTPAERGYSPDARAGVTSSTSRLVKFYKRFGFVENKGRTRDFSIGAGVMWRDPTAIPGQATAPRGDVRETPAFRAWFGDSKVLDDTGKPAVVYHGTTGDFTTFDRDRGNIESDFGAGFYFSNNPHDVGENYAGEGPDLSAKLERRVEQLENDSEHFGEDKTPEQLREEAKRQLGVEHGGLTMPVYLKLESPAILGGPEETRLEMEQKVDEETGDFLDEEPTGTLVDFVQALRDEASRYDDGDVEPAIEKIMEEASYDSIPLSKALDILKSDEHFNYYTDSDRGDIASHEIVRKALERVGFDGVIDNTVDQKFGSQRKTGKQMAGMDEETVHYIAFRADQIKSAIGNSGAFDPNDPNILKQERRGAIRFGPDRQFNIDLLERADLSTFLHESGHFFLEVFGDLADQLGSKPLEDLTEDQKHLLSDYGTTLQAIGVENRDQIGTEQHEQFARMFEAYLREGKAPSLALQTPFARFRAWLLSIYDSLKKLNVNLTPEVRGVLDRMLASDHAIAEAEQQRGVGAMFTTPEQAGMEPREFELYKRTVADAHQQAQQRVDERLMREVFREQTRAWKERQGEIRTAVESEVYQRPEYGAIEAMRNGTHPNGEPLVEGLITPPLQLSRAILEQRFGKERVKRLPRGIVGRDGGLDPDVVAGMFGYSSADAMLTAVENAPSMKDTIERETRRRMMEEQGSTLLDGSLHNKAQLAVANETRDEVIRAEMRALGRLRRTVDPFVKAERAKGRDALQQEQAERAYERRWFEAEAKLRIAIAEGHKQAEIDTLQQQVNDLKARARGGAAVIRAAIPPADVLRDAAEARINAMRIGDIQPAAFWSASRRAGQQALERAARQDFDGAITAKQQELINLSLYRQAEKALEDVEDRVRFAKSLGTPAARKAFGLAGQSYLDQVDGILDRFEFAKVSQKVLDRRGALSAFVSSLEAQGLPVDIPDELLDESRRRNYKQLTIDELRGVTDGLKELQHLARLKNRLLRAAEKRELDQVAGGVADTIRQNFSGSPATNVERDRRVSNERTRMIGDFFGSHRKMASLAREMDGFVDGGPVWEQLIRPLNEAADREADMTAAATKKFGDLIEQAYPRSEKRLLYEKVEVPEVGQSLSRMERLSIALNWGNEGNRDRIRRGEGWKDEQVQAILDSLDARDLKFVQGVLDGINAYWPEIAAKQERVYGIAPEKVEASEIVAKNGTIAGGYYPLKYDDRADPKAGAHLDYESANLGKAAAYAQSTTKRGHTKERVSNVKMPLRRDFGVIFEHVNQVIHDLTHHEALIDVNRVLSHKDVQKAIYETHGDLTYRQFKNGVRDVAFGQVPAVNAFERAIGHVRTGATVAGLGWSLSTAMLHLSSALPRAVVRIGPEWVAKGVARWTRDAVHMENTAKWIDDVSTMMRNRSRTQQREINELRNAVGVNTGKFSGWVSEIVDKTSMGTVSKQGLVDSYFYLVQQAQRIADIPTWLGQYEKSMASGVAEKDAIAHADQAVLDAFGGGQNKDLAAVQRGGPLLRLWTNFYSPFNVTYNLTVEANRRARFNDPGSIGRLAVDYLMLYSVPATMGMLIHGALKANPKQSTNDEDATTIAGELLRGHLAYAADTMLGFRELSGVIQGYQGYEGPAGARLFASVGRVISQAEHSAGKLHEGKPEEAFGRQFWLSLNDAGGVIFHYPSGQAGRTIDGIAALAEGKTNNPGALIVGAPKQK